MSSGYAKFMRCLNSGIPDQIDDYDFQECLTIDHMQVIYYKNKFKVDLVTSYERFKILTAVYIKKKRSDNHHLDGHWLSNYMYEEYRKHEDYLIRNIKEVPGQWFSIIRYIGRNNKFLVKLICEHLPYIESVQPYLIFENEYKNCELFVKLSQTILQHTEDWDIEWHIEVTFRDENKTYYLCNSYGFKIDCRFAFYKLHIKCDSIEFVMCFNEYEETVKLNSRIYDVMKLLIRKQKVIKQAKNYSNFNANALEKWKLNFMRMFTYQENLNKLRFGCN